MDIKGYEAFCDSWLRAWTGNRPEELIGFYSDEAYYRDPAFPDGLRGRDALLGYFRKLLARNPSWCWKRREIFVHETGFTLKWVAEIPAGDRVHVLEGLDIVETGGSRITRNEVYFDPTPLSP